MTIAEWAAAVVARNHRKERQGMFQDKRQDAFELQGDLSVDFHAGKSFEKKLRWMISNPPQQAFRVDVTPSMAEIMLQHNDGNRPLTKSTAAFYAKQMSEGHWKYTGEPIIFSSDGKLLNGQHRLSACVTADVAFPSLLLFGVEPDAFDKMDMGKKRTPADIFAIHGEKQYALLSAVIRNVWRYENTAFLHRPDLEPASAELWDFLNEKHDALRTFLGGRGHIFNKTGWGTPSTFVTMHYLCWCRASKVADEFFEQLTTGNNINSRSGSNPVIRLRSTLNADIKEKALGRGTSTLVKAAYIAKAWNAHRDGRSIGPLRWRGDQAPDEAFPRLK